MLSMSFLTQPREGLEFINFQSDDFYVKLSGFLENNINNTNTLSKDSVKGIKDIIEEFTGFRNVKIELVEEGNLSVDVGYFSPNHVLNSAGLDGLLKSTETTLYKWFVQNKNKVFKGEVDFRTGKVKGAFCDLPITMRINVNLSDTFPSDKIQKYNVSIAGILTGAIAHEIGHCYGGCALMFTVAADNVIGKAALRFYQGKASPEERVVVLQDMSAVMDLRPDKQAELQELAQNSDEHTAIMYFNKLVNQRNTTRALSLGVEQMSSEVIADVYAIRMGCGKGVIAAIGVLVDQGCITILLDMFTAGIVYTLFTSALFFPQLVLMVAAGIPGAALALGGIFIFVLTLILAYFTPGFSGVYNSNHRRFEDAVRQLIAKLKEVKGMPANERTELVADIEKLLEINKAIKPWYEGTFVKRFAGWMFAGADFKKQELEHFTQALGNNEMIVLAERLKSLA
jgi:hypothetical protein